MLCFTRYDEDLLPVHAPLWLTVSHNKAHPAAGPHHPWWIRGALLCQNYRRRYAYVRVALRSPTICHRPAGWRSRSRPAAAGTARRTQRRTGPWRSRAPASPAPPLPRRGTPLRACVHPRASPARAARASRASTRVSSRRTRTYIMMDEKDQSYLHASKITRS